MNVYDFDNTIFRGDSTARFLVYLIKRRPALAPRAVTWAWAGLLYAAGRIDKTTMKSRIYRVFAGVRDIDGEVAGFWRLNGDRIKEFYMRGRRPDDIIISASPEFLLRDECARLGVGLLIASRVDPATGAYDGLNCHGAEKVRRLALLRPEAVIDEFYSDSLSDAPLARLAARAYMVRGDELSPWPK